MGSGVNWVALIVFLVLFGAITWLGFAAANWRKGDLDQLHEWGLGGRRFGTVVTWFLVGGDLYTAYTFVAVPALAYGAGVGAMPQFAEGFRQFGNNYAVPALFLHVFPAWFVGIAFAAIGIGALVPAAIMSIAAANLYTRNIHREFVNRNPTDREEAQMAKWASLVVKFGALVFIIFVPTQYAIQLQLLGGIWIIQTLPSIMLGVYTRWFNAWALLVGWAAGMAAGTAMAAAAKFTPTYPIVFGGFTFPAYTALSTLVLNLVLAVVLTPLFDALRASRSDETAPADYYA